MAADLHAEPDEVRQAFRYLYARAALEGLAGAGPPTSCGRAGCSWCAENPIATRTTPSNRPSAWTREEEAGYVKEMQQLLGLG
jgi:hypothetical protein